LRQLNLAKFGGSGQNSIQAIGTDSRGNIYVAGTTSSPDFAVKNAAQPVFGEARILRTTDLGTTWTRVGSPPQDVNVVVPDPVTPQVLFAAGDKGIYKSTDGGAAWRIVFPFQSVFSFSGALVIDPGNHLRLAALVPFSGGLIRSVDGGENWMAGPLSCPISGCAGQLLADPTGSGALIVTAFGLSISRDWGTTFQPLRPPGMGSPSVAAFDPSHRGWIYAGTAAGVTGSLSLSTDFGATWVSKGSPPTIFSGILSLAVDPDQPDTLVAATPDGLYKSSDGAASWTRQGTPGLSFLPESHIPFGILGHRCAPSGGIFAAGSAGAGTYQVAYSADDGATWKTPQLTNITSVTAGAGCGVYVTRQSTSDAFVAKLAPDGSEVWSTFLGGSDQDAAVGLAVDAQDNVYVTGNTSSPDFPSTVRRIGVSGQNSVFVTRLSAEGRLEYSAVIGGESRNTASAIAVDRNRNVYVAGGTNSSQFPVTPGALVTHLSPGSYTGFVLKLSSDASLVYATYLGDSYTSPGAIQVDAGEEAIIAGAGPVPGAPPPTNGFPAFVMKLDRTASRVISSTYVQGNRAPSALVTDGQGNLFIAGGTGGANFAATPGGYQSRPPLVRCSSIYPVTDVYVTKLAAADWKPVYSAVLRAACAIQPGPMAVERSGAVVLGLATGGGLPLRSPLLGGPACSTNSSAIARLSPDGSRLEFATYLDNCGVPGIAPADDGSLYVGVSPGRQSSAGVLQLSAANAPAISLDGIANAFSGDASAVARGGLYSLAVPSLQPPVIDLGLNPSQDLPATLGGVEVKFDGIPAAILQTGPGKVIVVAPQQQLRARRPNNTKPRFTSVQVISQGVSSNIVRMPVAKSLPGLLTSAFLNPQPPFDSDGYVRNEDGTVNGPGHPAAAGSTITLFVTGMGATEPQVAPGSVAHSTAIVPVTPVYATWKRFSSTGAPAPETVDSLPAYLSALFQIPIQVPAQSLGGVVLENGVRRVLVGLQFTVAASTFIPSVSNTVGVYVK